VSVPRADARRVSIAGLRIENSAACGRAAARAGLQFYIACALVHHESGGKNIYGHDKGGVFSAPGDHAVTALNFFQFLVRVMNGETSNGVGPLQITYAGLRENGHRDGGRFLEMAEQGLRPWVPEDNMLYGFRVFVALLKKHGGDIAAAGAEYNGGGSPNADARDYGRKLKAEAAEWHARLNA
jgi:hypothetical protein